MLEMGMKFEKEARALDEKDNELEEWERRLRE